MNIWRFVCLESLDVDVVVAVDVVTHRQCLQMHLPLVIHHHHHWTIIIRHRGTNAPLTEIDLASGLKTQRR